MPTFFTATSHHFVEPLVPSFWTSVYSAHGFKNQGGSCVLFLLSGNDPQSQLWPGQGTKQQPLACWVWVLPLCQTSRLMSAYLFYCIKQQNKQDFILFVRKTTLKFLRNYPCYVHLFSNCLLYYISEAIMVLNNSYLGDSNDNYYNSSYEHLWIDESLKILLFMQLQQCKSYMLK